jgi:hypothetical protein
MTTRERLERKLELRREWAEKRDRKAAAAFAGAHSAVAMIPPGQPVLLDHYSAPRHLAALERHDSRMRAGIESEAMASHHASAAHGIACQLGSSIFSDDSDAVEALEERLAGLEAERDRITAYNKSARKAAKAGQEHGDLNLLDEKQKANLLSTMRVCPYHRRPGLPFPGYVLSNLSGNIKRNRDRLEHVKRVQARVAAAESSDCGFAIVGGDRVAVTFAEKPPSHILESLRGAGFYWSKPSWIGARENLPTCLSAVS